MADKIKKIKLPSGVTYEVYDVDAAHDVKYDGTNKKIQWSKDGSEYIDVVTAAKLREDMGLSKVLNFKGSATYSAIIAKTDAVVGDVWLATDDEHKGKEYVCIKDNNPASANNWEMLGFEIDLSNYLQKNTTYSGAAQNAGAHTHSVSGTVTVPTVAKTDNKLSIARTTDVEVQSNGTSTVLTGVKVSETDNALGEDATFTTTVTPTTTNVKATASGTAVSTTNASFVQSYPGVTSKLVKAEVVPAVANGTVVPAVTVASGSRPTKTVFGADIEASKVTIASTTNASKATAQTAVVYGTADVDTAVSIPNVTGNDEVTASHVSTNGSVASGSAANWGGTVSADGVLEITWITNVPTSVTLPTFTDAKASKVTLGTEISITPAKAADTTRKITPYTFTDVAVQTVSVDNVAVPVVSSNDEVEVAKAGTAVDVAKAGTAVSFATGALDAEGTGASILTGLGTATTADAITSVSISAQPTVALSTGATAGAGVISVVTGIASSETVTNGKDLVAAATAVAADGTVEALTGVSVKTQPVFTLNGADTTGISYVSAVTLGTEDASLNNGVAASNGAHTHDVYVEAE